LGRKSTTHLRMNAHRIPVQAIITRVKFSRPISRIKPLTKKMTQEKTINVNFCIKKRRIFRVLTKRFFDYNL
jgi:hypothetical protein